MEKQDINGDTKKFILEATPKRKRKPKPVLSTPVDTRSNNMSREETDLATHVEICAIRYQGIQEKIDGLTQRLDQVETKINTLSTTIQSNFSRIELALEKASAKRDVQLIATIGTVAVAVISVVGYFIIH